VGAQIKDPVAELIELARGDERTLQVLSQMHEGNFEASGLDEETYYLVRVAALQAMGAPPISWLAHLGAARRHNIPPDGSLGP
jgi:4-carboxymuconolactone decarboxylase